MKTQLAVGIIIFWLVFPFGIVLTQSNMSFISLDTTEYSTMEEPTGFTFIAGLWSFIAIYFKAMFLFIPNSPKWASLIVLILQIISGLTIYLLLREG